MKAERRGHPQLLRQISKGAGSSGTPLPLQGLIKDTCPTRYTVCKRNYFTGLIPYFTSSKFLQFQHIVIAWGEQYSNYRKFVK